MSVVTDLILTEFDSVGGFSLIPPMDEINLHLDQFNSYFVKVDEHAGGSKYMQTGVWLAAVNHLGPLEDLVQVIREQHWEYPEAVRLLVQEENEEGFKVVFPF